MKIIVKRIFIITYGNNHKKLLNLQNVSRI